MGKDCFIFSSHYSKDCFLLTQSESRVQKALTNTISQEPLHSDWLSCHLILSFLTDHVITYDHRKS